MKQSIADIVRWYRVQPLSTRVALGAVLGLHLFAGIWAFFHPAQYERES